ncbi:hypothetical protein LRP50_24920 [Enterovibrio sp. ZSDZ42]|uniref:Uncharacterized protein n=1 Tax=Enterovibrio gelatinilyticus TaxID=2899819 RepID=A0ABT5R7W4_9GAMM|nr:hypothetical protein [Enterovibrio sp. ZSDZ42]MDD1796367.1 hypothetical protein [Enterovibrio sp. ZSDZ42]
MSKISISVANSVDSLEATKFLHRLLGMSLSTAKTCLNNGNNGAFFSGEIFLNDHNEIADKIRKIISFFDTQNIEIFIVEVNSDVDWEGAFNESNRISTSAMLDILGDADGCFH